MVEPLTCLSVRAKDGTAEQTLQDNGVDILKPVIAINPGATGGTAKRWFPNRFAELSAKLAEHFGVKVLIFGGPGDNALGEEISGLSGNVCVNLAGKTNLAQAFALIERCSLFITNDSGLMHAAAALGINQVAIIGSTNHITNAAIQYQQPHRQGARPLQPLHETGVPVRTSSMHG